MVEEKSEGIICFSDSSAINISLSSSMEVASLLFIQFVQMFMNFSLLFQPPPFWDESLDMDQLMLECIILLYASLNSIPVLPPLQPTFHHLIDMHSNVAYQARDLWTDVSLSPIRLWNLTGKITLYIIAGNTYISNK